MEEASMNQRILWCIALISLVLVGHVKAQSYTSSPPVQRVGTSHFQLVLEPLKAEGYDYYNRFRYELTNNTRGDLVIDWSKSYYLRNGKRFGNFGWEGLTFEQLRGIKAEPLVTIGPDKKDAIEIFPLELVGWREEGVRMKSNKPEAGFTLTPLPDGENGLSIAVLKDGKVLRKSIIVNITKN
jgi:hypothetical protein